LKSKKEKMTWRRKTPTTNQGVPVSDTQNSLPVGERKDVLTTKEVIDHEQK
jgi:catalase